tara:strand:+ start:496 stop:849 length:354 start_codon:yes stop_codon:yes gene_type:complete
MFRYIFLNTFDFFTCVFIKTLIFKFSFLALAKKFVMSRNIFTKKKNYFQRRCSWKSSKLCFFVDKCFSPHETQGDPEVKLYAEGVSRMQHEALAGEVPKMYFLKFQIVFMMNYVSFR